jgi:hypothetical protein
MMHGVRYFVAVCAALSLACLGSPSRASAQTPEEDAEGSAFNPAVGTEAWVSTDSEGTDVVKLAGRALWSFEGKDDYAGIVVEQALFTPATGEKREFTRVYLDVADKLSEGWRWRARVGTDGQTVLGSAELRRADWSRSFFIEREIIETQEGLNRRIYYTFVGASTDIPIDHKNTLAVTTGIQEFSGKNERLHLRARFVHVLKESAGLSAQMDLRYYHSTEPNEFDYFSPTNFVRAIPILQMRRFNAGWVYLATGGYGAQRSTGGGWQPARLLQLRVESPRSSKRIDAFAELVYSNDSIVGGLNYDYLQGRAGLTLAF